MEENTETEVLLEVPEPEVQPETQAPATLQSTLDNLLETLTELSNRLRDGKKGLSPAAGNSIQNVATAVGILQNQIFIKESNHLNG